MLNKKIKQQTMKKLILILACVSICAVGCKTKTTEQSNQTQDNIELEEGFTDMQFCQSCAMPMAENDFGTNADGTSNDLYCKYCYVDGKFTEPDITMEGMIERCVPFMVEQGWAEDEARSLLEENLPLLERWQIQD
jgi:hypothetical protein